MLNTVLSVCQSFIFMAVTAFAPTFGVVEYIFIKPVQPTSVVCPHIDLDPTAKVGGGVSKFRDLLAHPSANTNHTPKFEGPSSKTVGVPLQDGRTGGNT